MIRVLLLLLLSLLLVVPISAQAQMGGKKGGKMAQKGKKPAQPPSEALSGLEPEVAGAFFPTMATLDAMRAKGFMPTGLVPGYPLLADCPVVGSGFASRTRGDGSRRSVHYFQGQHSGMDIPVPEGTPILAMADGLVVHTSEGLNIGGIGLTLQHAPQDTGLLVWTYTEYKHLRELPDLEVGQRVRRGQAVAVAGATGTTGGYYGEAGHSHLHLAAMMSPGSGFKGKAVVIPQDGQWLDPLALFLTPPIDTQSVAALPDDKRTVPVAYALTDGTVRPPDARVIWPFACTPR